jgi:hypothetical protein
MMTAATPDPSSTGPTAPEDTALTESGLAATGQGRVLLIACGALAREILDLKKRNRWDHMDLTCLPAILHNSPEKITDAVRAAVGKHHNDYSSIFVVYADWAPAGCCNPPAMNWAWKWSPAHIAMPSLKASTPLPRRMNSPPFT